jgi:hypothetical protein
VKIKLLLGSVCMILLLINSRASFGQIPVNPELTNGDFEAGDLSLGWMTGGTMNYAVERIVDVSGNHFAQLTVGNGPSGNSCCTDPELNNFGYLDQLFTMSMNRFVELDFRVPPPVQDNTETANCPGFDRIEIDFAIGQIGELRALAVVVIDLNPEGQLTGLVIVNDIVYNTYDYALFNPSAFTPTSVGPLSLTESATLTGWLHASLEVSTSAFPWLSDDTTRISVRNEDNRNSGRQLSVLVDNVSTRAILSDPTEQIADILTSIDQSSSAGTLEGTGSGLSSELRLHAFKNMLSRAEDLIAIGDFLTACAQLNDAYKKTDGLARPPDLVTGEAAADLAQMIRNLMDALSS